MQISIVIVNWNAGWQLKDCVESVVRYSEDLSVEIIVVDNGSTDGSLLPIYGLSNIRVIETGENLGFGKACNIGAKEAKGEYLLFLNPDATIFHDTLKTVYNFMQAPENKNVGVCGVQLVNEQNEVDRSCTKFPNFLTMFSRTLGIDRFFPRFSYFMGDWDHKNSADVDHVIGAFYLVRKSIFDTALGFDERFFVYLEDLDLSYRIKYLGYRIRFLSEAQAFHTGGGVSRQVKAHRLFYSWRSRLLYVFKHFGFLSASLIMFSTLLLEPFSRSVFSLVKGNVSGVKETWSAWSMLLAWLLRWWFKGETRS